MAPRGYTNKYVPMFKSNSMGLEEFIEHVGIETLGLARWEAGKQQKVLRFRIIEDVFCGLESDSIEACIWLNVESKASCSLEKIEFGVDSRYWVERSPQSLESLLQERRYTIPSEYLYFIKDKRKYFMDDYYNKTDTESQYLRIKDGSDLFATSHEKIPSRFFERYKKYTQLVTTEMVAFAWRTIAIRGDIKKEDLVEEIEFYLRNQGLKDNELPGRDKIRLIASRVREQRRRADINSTILVSGNSADKKSITPKA